MTFVTLVVAQFSHIGTHRNFVGETTLGNEPVPADGGWNPLSTQNLVVEVHRDLPYRSSWDNGKEISSFLCWSHQFGPRRLKDRHDWLADRENRTGTSAQLIERPDRACQLWTVQRSIRVEEYKSISANCLIIWFKNWRDIFITIKIFSNLCII